MDINHLLSVEQTALIRLARSNGAATRAELTSLVRRCGLELVARGFPHRAPVLSAHA